MCACKDHAPEGIIPFLFRSGGGGEGTDGCERETTAGAVRLVERGFGAHSRQEGTQP